MGIGHPKHGHEKQGRVDLTGSNTDDAIVAKSREEVAGLECRVSKPLACYRVGDEPACAGEQ
jgi:hypothetical protein